MGLQSNTFRRGATYAWRRRLPAALGGRIMQISLRTNDPLIARRLGPIATAESYSLFDAMMTQGLSRDDARRLLTHVIERELDRISRAEAVAADDPAGWGQDRSHDWAAGKAYQLLAERGASAANLTQADVERLIAEGRSEADLARLQTMLDTEAGMFAEPPGQGANARVKTAMQTALGREGFSNLELFEGRQIWLRGRGAGLLTSLSGDAPFEEAMELAAGLARGSSPAPVAPPAPVAQPVSQPIATATPVAPVVWPAPIGWSGFSLSA